MVDKDVPVYRFMHAGHLVKHLLFDLFFFEGRTRSGVFKPHLNSNPPLSFLVFAKTFDAFCKICISEIDSALVSGGPKNVCLLREERQLYKDEESLVKKGASEIVGDSFWHLFVHTGKLIN